MKHQYRCDARIDEIGHLRISELPFHPGDEVEVIVRTRRPQPDSKDRYPLRGLPYRYDRPTDPVAEDQDALTKLCRRHHIARLSLFGSVLKGNDRPGSDIDLLVEFEPDGIPGLLGLAAIEAELAALLGGRPVDLRTAEDLSRHFRDEVVRQAEVQHAA